MTLEEKTGLMTEVDTRGKLPRTWPATNDQLACTVNQPGLDKTLFPYGYGLSY